MNDIKKICTIIVLYKHDNTLLEKIVDNIYPSSSLVVLINNDSRVNINKNILSREKVLLINNDVNMGASVAYNQGIIKAYSENCDYAFLLDQDSMPSERLIPVLAGKIYNSDVTMIGTSYIEYEKKYDERFYDSEEITFSIVKHNIASGSLICVKKFIDAGKYDEDMFMEYFDTDWCLRATKLNHKIFKLDNKLLCHKIGISSKKVSG